MMAKSHVFSAMLVATVIPLSMGYKFEHTIDTWLYLVVAGLGGFISDIDEQNSALGRRLLFISIPLNKLVGHRTITHNLFIGILGAIYSWYQLQNYLLFGFFIGIITHIIGDALTGNVKGALWPVSNKFILLPKVAMLRVGGIGDYTLMYLSAIGLLTIHIHGVVYGLV